MKVPFCDLAAALRPVRGQMIEEFEKALDGMELYLGPNTRAFEEEFAGHCQTAYGIGLSSGTDAVFAALTACGIGPGDEVIVPSHTFIATIEAIVHTGATPVFVDVEPERLTVDVGAIPAAISSTTRAIVPVHLYGQPADMDPILEIARAHRLRVVEDAAQAHGARYKGRVCGGLGDIGCFSFYFTKNLGALGEAGFVTTDDPELAQAVRLLRDHGRASKTDHVLLGHNLRMDELQAIVLRLKLPRLEAGNERRRELARLYTSILRAAGIWTLQDAADSLPVYHLYPIRIANRDRVRTLLAENGIGTGIHYPRPAHLQPALRSHPHRCGDLRTTEAVCKELLSLPMFPELTTEQVHYVSDCVVRHVRGRAAPAAGAVSE